MYYLVVPQGKVMDLLTLVIFYIPSYISLFSKLFTLLSQFYEGQVLNGILWTGILKT